MADVNAKGQILKNNNTNNNNQTQSRSWPKVIIVWKRSDHELLLRYG